MMGAIFMKFGRVPTTHTTFIAPRSFMITFSLTRAAGPLRVPGHAQCAPQGPTRREPYAGARCVTIECGAASVKVPNPHRELASLRLGALKRSVWLSLIEEVVNQVPSVDTET